MNRFVCLSIYTGSAGMILEKTKQKQQWKIQCSHSNSCHGNIRTVDNKTIPYRLKLKLGLKPMYDTL